MTMSSDMASRPPRRSPVDGQLRQQLRPAGIKPTAAQPDPGHKEHQSKYRAHQQIEPSEEHIGRNTLRDGQCSFRQDQQAKHTHAAELDRHSLRDIARRLLKRAVARHGTATV